MKNGLIIDENGTKYWYLNGMKLSEEEYLRTTRNNKLTELGI